MSIHQVDRSLASVSEPSAQNLSQLMGNDLRDHFERAILENLPVYRQLTEEFGFGFRFGDKTCFDHISKELVVGVTQLLDLGLKDINAFHFAVLHEIKHYQDLVSDPVSYQKLIAKGTRDDGLGGLYFGLYNCTEDVSVNQRNRFDSAHFRSDDGLGYSELISNTYREHLFKERDFAAIDPASGKLKQLLCEQYASYILNLGMGVADDISVSPEVQEVINRPITIYGTSYTLAEFIEEVLKPTPKSEGARLGNTLQNRLEFVQEYLEPRFEELLEKDKAREDTASIQGRNTQLGAPGGSSKEDFEGAAKIILDKDAEDKKSPAERNAERLKKQREQLADEAGLNPEEAKDFLSRLDRLDPVIKDLRDFWLSIPQFSKETEIVYDGPRKVGIRPNIPALTRQSLGVVIGDPNLRFMETQEEIETLIVSPQRIRVRLVVDASHSMKDHMDMVADLAVALAVSFQSANASAQIEELDFNCETEFITFGKTAQHVVNLTKEISLSAIMGAYKFFFKYQAETRDHLAYSLIQKSIKPDDTDSDLRRSGELFDLALVITDGEPTARAIEPDRLKLMSINGIHALESAGLVVRAYGIGKIPVFDEIWNGDGIERGKQVASARQLLAATQLLFREELSRRYPGLGVSESAQDG